MKGSASIAGSLGLGVLIMASSMLFAESEARAAKSVYGRARVMLETCFLGDARFAGAVTRFRDQRRDLGLTRAQLKAWRMGRHARTKLSHALQSVQNLASVPWLAPQLAEPLQKARAETNRAFEGRQTGKVSEAELRRVIKAQRKLEEQVDPAIGDLLNEAYGAAAEAYLRSPSALEAASLGRVLEAHGLAYEALPTTHRRALGKLVRAKKGLVRAVEVRGKALETRSYKPGKAKSADLYRALETRAAFEHFEEGLDLLVRRGLGILAEGRSADADPLMDAILALPSARVESTPGAPEPAIPSPQEFAAMRADAYDPGLVIDAVHALISAEADPVVH